MRLAEKKGRASTCAFADEAALATISAYRLHVPLELQEAYKQTVLAGILLLDTEAAALTVVALGVGTKVRQTDGSDGGATTLRDMHAEVLARRGLQRYLCIQLQRHQTGDGGGIFSATAGDGRLGLRAGLSFHIYSSSQPCGNACVKRWAKSRRPAVYAGLGRYEWPIDSHARLQVSARANGQVAPLLKRVRISNEEEADGDERGEQEGGVTFAFPPPGITLCTSMSSKPLSCSDKIAKWQCLGLQGSLLAGRLLPVKLSTVTVGRKFSLVHLERAVCCRYQAWRAPGGYVVQHPAMLCTAQKVMSSVSDDCTD